MLVSKGKVTLRFLSPIVSFACWRQQKKQLDRLIWTRLMAAVQAADDLSMRQNGFRVEQSTLHRILEVSYMARRAEVHN